MNIIDSVKRLERAGGENSRTTEKLKEAAVEVAQLIKGSCPVGVTLPRDYRVIEVKSNIGTKNFLAKGIKGPEAWTEQTREGALVFAADIAGGLLDEIADFLEARATESERAALHLERAK